MRLWNDSLILVKALLSPTDGLFLFQRSNFWKRPKLFKLVIQSFIGNCGYIIFFTFNNTNKEKRFIFCEQKLLCYFFLIFQLLPVSSLIFFLESSSLRRFPCVTWMCFANTKFTEKLRSSFWSPIGPITVHPKLHRMAIGSLSLPVFNSSGRKCFGLSFKSISRENSPPSTLGITMPRKWGQRTRSSLFATSEESSID